jgi:hypothetical protein
MPPSSLPSRAGFLSERGRTAHFQYSPGIKEAVELDEFSDESSPASLVTGAQPRTIIAVEVFKEVDVVAPKWVTLEFFRTAIDRPPAMFVAQEDANEPVRDLLTHLEKVHEFPGSHGTLDFEVVAVIQIEVISRFSIWNHSEFREFRNPVWSSMDSPMSVHMVFGLT